MLGLLSEIPIAVIVIAGLCAPLASWMAMRRSRSAGIWFLLGALTGPIAAAILVVAPPGRCPDCDARITGWPGACAACGARLSSVDLGGSIADESPVEARAPASGAPVPARGGAAVDGAASGSRAAAAGIARAPLAATPLTVPPSSNGRNGPFGGLPAGSAAAVPSAASAATALRDRAPDTRPGGGGRRTRRAAPPPEGDVHASGIYLSGNAGMTIGALYALARVDDRIRVFGPVDVGDLSVRLERALAEVEIAAIDDRIVITTTGRSVTSIVLRAVGGKRGQDLEAAFSSTAPAGGRVPHG